MKFERLAIPEVILFTPARFGVLFHQVGTDAGAWAAARS